jgi:thiamine-monophosphate kinase
VHFDRAFVSASDVGHKALAVNLSDLAAMGAAPRTAVLSLILPASMTVADTDALVDSMAALATRSRIAIVGGNIAASPGPLIVDVTATGSVHRRRILTRSGARPGDEMYVSGSIGAAAAGLRRLRADHRSATPETVRYLRPEPRTRLGMLLGRNRVTRACIDLSDGFAAAVRQMAEASGVGAVIEADALPIEPKTATLHEALGGGEDYELLFAVSPKQKRRLTALQRLLREVPIRRVGRFTGGGALSVEVKGAREELPAGFQHFLQPQ